MAYDATSSVLSDIERYCNNYFNPRNDPNDPTRNYPPEFLELAGRIQQFSDMPANFTGGDPAHPVYVPWQSVFALELSIYKRLKTV